MGHGALALNQRGEKMEREELLRLAYIEVAQAAELLAKAGEELLAEEAEALAEAVDLRTTALS
jgi:hypothetical protein